MGLGCRQVPAGQHQQLLAGRTLLQLACVVCCQMLLVVGSSIEHVSTCVAALFAYVDNPTAAVTGYNHCILWGWSHTMPSTPVRYTGAAAVPQLLQIVGGGECMHALGCAGECLCPWVRCVGVGLANSSTDSSTAECVTQ